MGSGGSVNRRAWLLTALGSGALMGCRGSQPLPAVRTVEGPAREYLVVELVRTARVAGLPRSIDVSACQWRVSGAGALYGDHWGWCEDFRILPRSSPGYLILTTEFSGEMSGGYGKLLPLPALPATVEAFGRPVRLEERGGQLRLEFGEATATLAARERAPLGGERTAVEPPIDTGHFEPGFERPVPADVTYQAVSYGRLDSRRIAGRGT